MTRRTLGEDARQIDLQLLDVASKPALWLTRAISPRLILDQHIPLATVSWLVIAWFIVVKYKVELCLQAGAQACL